MENELPYPTAARREIIREPREEKLDPTPIFIIGYRRSGTTLLSWILDSHPRIAALPENCLCGSFLSELKREGGADTNKPGAALVAAFGAAQLGEPATTFFRRLASVINTVCSGYATRSGKVRWASKEVYFHNKLDDLDCLFDYQPKYLYMVRHGVDAAYSAAQRFGRLGCNNESSSLSLVNYLKEWVDANEAVARFAERNRARCHFVRYENLVRFPDKTVAELFAFLEEAWDPSSLSEIWKLEHSPFLGANSKEDMGKDFDPSRTNRWINWPPELVHQLGEIANGTLTRIGYPAL